MFALARGGQFVAASGTTPVDAPLTSDPEQAWRAPTFEAAQERANLLRIVRGLTFQIHGLR